MPNTQLSIQDQVYLKLRTSILNFQLPPGTTMSTQEIASKFQVSRTPVREAFLRLQREGLVQILPQKETMVSLIDMNRVQQERFLRLHTEQAAIKTFWLKKDESHLRRLHILIEKQLVATANGDQDLLHLYDNEFHSVFFEGAGLSFIWELINQSSTHYQRIRLLSLRHQEILDNNVLQHQELLHLLETDQLEALLKLHHTHLSKLNLELETLQRKNPEYFLIPDPIQPLSL